VFVGLYESRSRIMIWGRMYQKPGAQPHTAIHAQVNGDMHMDVELSNGLEASYKAHGCLNAHLANRQTARTSRLFLNTLFPIQHHLIQPTLPRSDTPMMSQQSKRKRDASVGSDTDSTRQKRRDTRGRPNQNEVAATTSTPTNGTLQESNPTERPRDGGRGPAHNPSLGTTHAPTRYVSYTVTVTLDAQGDPIHTRVVLQKEPTVPIDDKARLWQEWGQSLFGELVAGQTQEPTEEAEEAGRPTTPGGILQTIKDKVGAINNTLDEWNDKFNDKFGWTLPDTAGGRAADGNGDEAGGDEERGNDGPGDEDDEL